MRQFFGMLLVTVFVVVSLCSIVKETRSGESPPGASCTCSDTLLIAFGSCAKTELDQSIWNDINSRSRDIGGYDAFVWGGDNIYADVERKTWEKVLYSLFPPLVNFESGVRERASHVGADPERLRRLYDVQDNLPGYKAFVSSGVPIEGIWDDHDYGINDGDRLYEFRKESQQLFLDFFRVPESNERRRRDGIYYSRSFDFAENLNGKCSCLTDDNGTTSTTSSSVPPKTRVKLIMLDVRFFRDPWELDETVEDSPHILGDAQWKWLEEELLSSDNVPDVAIIFSGFQVLPKNPYGPHETWSRAPIAKRRLLRLQIRAQMAGTRTLLVSGDVHFSEINEEICVARSPDGEVRTYRMAEYTSSGMTHAWQSDILNWPKSYVVAILFQHIFYASNAISRWLGVNRHRSRDSASGEDLIYGGRNFGEIQVRRSSSSPSRNGDLLVRTVGIGNVVGLEKSWELEDTANRFANATVDFQFKCVPQHYDYDFSRRNGGDIDEDAIWSYDVRHGATRECLARWICYAWVGLFVLVAFVPPVRFVRGFLGAIGDEHALSQQQRQNKKGD